MRYAYRGRGRPCVCPVWSDKADLFNKYIILLFFLIIFMLILYPVSGFSAETESPFAVTVMSAENSSANLAMRAAARACRPR